ncbi:MAG: serine/threonine protein kinase, partial [Deltaproteobacteria bacterium]|nr:serine/threonine protein kinase [Deltaproteobacteria bacterium]
MRHPTVEALLTRTPENEAHLAGCPDCRLIVEMMRFAPDEAQDAAPRDVPIIERSVFTDWEELPDGRGGMGKLWRAFDTRLGRQVAVKQVRASPGADRDLHASLLRRLEREARFTARLQHPAIVAVYEVGRFPDGELFYAMPLVPGRPLAKEIDERRTLEARLGLLPQLTSVAEAIAYAHEKGVVHRDIKPQNILVGAFGEAVVIDWGLAKEWGPLGDRAGDEGTAQTPGHAQMPGHAQTLEPAQLPAAPEDGLTEFGVGTPQYMAPEQARGEQPTPLVDVYALGSTLYHALTGQPPYGLAESKEIRKALLVAPPRALTEAVPDVPPELAH